MGYLHDEVAGLAAIQNLGYPFDFETENLSSSKKIIRSLLKKEFIKKNTNSKIRRLGTTIKYVLVNLDFWQECFISYLTLSRDLPFHMGYVTVFRPNYAWHMQGASCWWEHCIEFMPVPPVTKSETIDHINFIKEQFKKGAYIDKSEEDIKFLQEIINRGVPDDTPDERDLEMEKSSCPIWGHCCPDGKEQAKECREIMK
ncbi:hypothetical protein ACR776_04195 [Sphingobacterium spiritivorum]|uniref:hypothetical protein n=1 Tax=Sphingobacterium spiritivorum TaxID=258 RepID=UPI003DA2A1FF